MKGIFSIVFFMLSCFIGLGQMSRQDIELVVKHQGQKERIEDREVRYGFGEGRLVANIFLAPFMYAYQKAIAPQISASCLYHPSCSEFSRELFQRYGVLKAFLSSTDRLMRCDRISAADIHYQQVNQHTGKMHESVNYYRFKQPLCDEEGQK